MSADNLNRAPAEFLLARKRFRDPALPRAFRMLTNAANKKCHIYCIQIERDSAMDRGNLAHLTALVTVVDSLSFRAAASQLGVNRTTRSVSDTDAGSGSGHCLYIAPQKCSHPTTSHRVLVLSE
jgi:hypothetical protein